MNDNISNISYTFIPMIINDVWDIWKPVNDNYMNIALSNNIWNINIYDYSNNLIDFNEFYCDILEVLEVNNGFELKIANSYLFKLRDKIKIISSKNNLIDNMIIDINNDIITIKKNNLKLDDFINAKIFNHKFQFSLIFKYFPIQ